MQALQVHSDNLNILNIKIFLGGALLELNKRPAYAQQSVAKNWFFLLYVE